MNKVINFPEREFKVQIELPKDKIINIRKTSEDKIKLEFTEEGSFAYVQAANLYHAQDIAKRILPDSKIVGEPWIAG
jgi:type IV secretory pathway ATPase VirB11/archaellum biosynthesis ATPase